jgi:hypothetical protein
MAYGSQPLVPTDTIFARIGASTSETEPGEVDYQSRVRAMIEDAISFNDEWRAPNRELAQRYYDGLEPQLEDEGRSTIVSTEVRDTVMAIIPSLIRIFCSAQHVCNFIPRTEAAVQMAEQATDYVDYVYMYRNEGFLITHSIIKDALIKGEACAKWWTENKYDVTHETYENISLEQRQFIISQPDAQVVHEVIRNDPRANRTPMAPQMAPPEPRFDLEIRRVKTTPCVYVEAVPPDEFLISRDAKCVKYSSLVGHRTLKGKSELIEMGYPEEIVNKYLGGSSTSIRWASERVLRNPGLDMEGSGRDSRDRLVTYSECYIRIDSDGDGIAELHKICTLGDNHDIVADDMVNRVKMCMFSADPEPHTAFGHSIAEQVEDIQKIKSNILRNTLDSLAQTIYPRLKVVENMANMDDVLNNELGAPIRVKDPSAIEQLAHTFEGEKSLELMQYMDAIERRRTGISEASQGLDPRALQSTNVKGVDMVVSGAQERIELIARILAETGMRDIFTGLLQEITDNPPKEDFVRLRGVWTPVYPDKFDPTMQVEVNPALGRGSDFDRFLMLAQIKQTQEQIIMQMGPGNMICGPIEYRNTLQDMLAIAGMKDASRYFRQIDTQQLQQELAKPPKPSPADQLSMVELEKIRSRTAGKIADIEYKYDKMKSEDQFKYDKMQTDATLEASQIRAQWGADISDAELQTMLSREQQIHEALQNELDRRHEAKQNAAAPPGGAG